MVFSDITNFVALPKKVISDVLAVSENEEPTRRRLRAVEGNWGAMADATMKSINAFMVMGKAQLLTVVDTVNLVNQTFEVPVDRTPEAHYDYDHLCVNCGDARFSEEALEDAAQKAIHKVEIHYLMELSPGQSRALLSGFRNALQSIEICYGSAEHSTVVNAFLKRQLVTGSLEQLTLLNCVCGMATLEDEVVRFLWRRGDSKLKVVLDEPTAEECIGFELLNTFVEMTYTHHPERKRRKTAEVYLKASKRTVEEEVAKRDFPRSLLDVRVETVSRRFSNYSKMFLTYEYNK
ncbi:hypothetical protein QR680_004049 [Steinernema hermaphroditum]|uniref:Uncharacterized protein n=1 Tax=Steinernema hermaphroditum TaxID=289476 RepID=A0AA39LSL3_9BILA|nr:hypothetical protein QR680_004049 [Steinernema hermaphroditum]